MLKKSLLKKFLIYGIATSSLFIPDYISARNNNSFYNTHFYYKLSRNKEQGGDFIVGYKFNAELPLGFSLDCIGDVNLSNKKGATWNYGKINLKKNINERTRFDYDIHMKKKEDGRISSDLEHRFQIRINF